MSFLKFSIFTVVFSVFGMPLSFADSAVPAEPHGGGVYKKIVAGPGCRDLNEEEVKLLDKYRAWHFCYAYKYEKDADFFSEVTNIVYDGINIVAPITKYIDLYQPTQDSLRFKVSEVGGYRLYNYWCHDVGHVPPPGKYTDHKFINITDRSIDYWWKLRQRGTGKNARIRGVAEVVFVPDELFDIAIRDGYLQSITKLQGCHK